LIGLKKYALEDERIDFFKHFLGFDEQYHYSRDVLELYIALIKASNETI
jgi:hypothetical protein